MLEYMPTTVQQKTCPGMIIKSPAGGSKLLLRHRADCSVPESKGDACRYVVRVARSRDNERLCCCAMASCLSVVKMLHGGGRRETFPFTLNFTQCNLLLPRERRCCKRGAQQRGE
jgi:hypothetical protein